jgi:hypothetical protein
MQHVIQSKWCMNPPFPLTSRKLIRSEIYLQIELRKVKYFVPNEAGPIALIFSHHIYT